MSKEIIGEQLFDFSANVSGCEQSFLSESWTFSPTAFVLVVGFGWWRNGGGGWCHAEKGRCWTSSFPEALASLCILELKCRCRITLGFFILVNQKEIMTARAKVAGPAFNSCPSMPVDGDVALTSQPTVGISVFAFSICEFKHKRMLCSVRTRESFCYWNEPINNNKYWLTWKNVDVLQGNTSLLLLTGLFLPHIQFSIIFLILMRVSGVNKIFCLFTLLLKWILNFFFK